MKQPRGHNVVPVLLVLAVPVWLLMTVVDGIDKGFSATDLLGGIITLLVLLNLRLTIDLKGRVSVLVALREEDRLLRDADRKDLDEVMAGLARMPERISESMSKVASRAQELATTLQNRYDKQIEVLREEVRKGKGRR